jgi:superfamily II DNA/RNA helicase
MLGLNLRHEFKGKRLKGTAIELSNESNTGATQIAAAQFLEITYPTHDLLKGIEAVGPNQGRPVVVIGERGLGKSHLMAAFFHAVHDPASTRAWLKAWATTLNDPVIGAIPLRKGMLVIGESLHRQRYKFLWDLLFEQHPHGTYIRGKWEGMGGAKTDIPSDQLILELLRHTPTMLLLDEFQTWYDGLTNTKQYPWKNWAFNFIQILSEISKEHPDLLALVVSVRNGDTDAYQQIHRVNPVQIDFKAGGSPERIQHDRRRMLLHRLFENRIQISQSGIDGLIAVHISEYLRLIHSEWKLNRDALGRTEADRVMAELKYRLAKKLDEEALEMASDPYGDEFAAAHAEDVASAVIDLHLPEERLRIQDLLSVFPQSRETKAQKLLDGLGTLWRQHSAEKIVIFATYLGTVDLLAREIEQVYPGQGVVVLRGGDHGAKVAAERRFRQKDGPKVLVCTAAGREGINLQFARVLFNFDLPWNPMDMEQRIGRIHRYGQAHTAQVYNLVLSDTIEGRIFLLLDDKLNEIARTLGKVDDQGNVAEDLRSQILGQLSERLNYDKLYQEALSDPELKRTAVELEAALSNAREAREVVFDLFQDLEGFSLDDYKPFSDVTTGMDRLIHFLSAAVADRQQRIAKVDETTYDLQTNDGKRLARFTSNREIANSRDDIELLGLDHRVMQEELGRWRSLPPEEIGIAVHNGFDAPILLSFWLVESSTGNGERRVAVQNIAVRPDGTRVPAAERQADQYLCAPPAAPAFTPEQRSQLFQIAVEPTLQRELKHKGAANGDGSYSATLIGYVEAG